MSEHWYNVTARVTNPSGISSLHDVLVSASGEDTAETNAKEAVTWGGEENWETLEISQLAECDSDEQ